MGEREELPLGSCCERLSELLRRPFDEKLIFEREGMLALTSGWNAEHGDIGSHHIREFARYCPFCGNELHFSKEVLAPWAREIH